MHSVVTLKVQGNPSMKWFLVYIEDSFFSNTDVKQLTNSVKSNFTPFLSMQCHYKEG